MAKESATVQIKTQITCACDSVRLMPIIGLLVSSRTFCAQMQSVQSAPVLPYGGTAKLGEDHLQTLGSLNNLASLLKAQERLAEAEPLYQKALDKSLGAQQGFQRDFGHWIWSHTFLDFCWSIRFVMTETGACNTLGTFSTCFGQKLPKLHSFQSTSWQMP